MTEYARSTVVYRALGNGRDLSFGFRCNPWGSGTTGGSSFYGLIQTAPAESSAVVADASTIRQCDISLRLHQEWQEGKRHEADPEASQPLDEAGRRDDDGAHRPGEGQRGRA